MSRGRDILFAGRSPVSLPRRRVRRRNARSAASACTGRRISAWRAFADDCAAKRYYKRALCELAVERKQVRDVAACVADPGFAGPTVRNGGVGG